eukprot:scaffold12000_cov18-Tisochrysis_lutea.AAC.3
MCCVLWVFAWLVAWLWPFGVPTSCCYFKHTALDTRFLQLLSPAARLGSRQYIAHGHVACAHGHIARALGTLLGPVVCACCLPGQQAAHCTGH